MVAAVVGIMYLPPAEKAETAEHTVEEAAAEREKMAVQEETLPHIPGLPVLVNPAEVVPGTLPTLSKKTEVQD